MATQLFGQWLSLNLVNPSWLDHLSYCVCNAVELQMEKRSLACDVTLQKCMKLNLGQQISYLYLAYGTNFCEKQWLSWNQVSVQEDLGEHWRTKQLF